MINNFVSYWIKHQKIMRLAIVLVALGGIGGWISLPKQYNPDIVMPSFQLILQAPGYSSQEIQHNIVQPLERAFKEIPDIDTTMSVATNNFASSMIMFKVGTEKEAAYTRLVDKLESNKNKIPFGIQNYQIVSFDPDDIPIYTLALYYTGNQSDSAAIHTTRSIGLDIIEQLKTIDAIGAITIVGGEAENITIEIDPDAVAQQGVDIMQVYNVINANNLRSMGGSYKENGNVHSLTIDGTIKTIEDIENLTVTSVYDTPIYIKDIATVRYGESNKKHITLYTSGSQSYREPVYIGIAKKKGTNAVVVVKELEEQLQKIQQKLPEGYSFTAIQDEGKTADHATSKLLHELLNSVVVLFIVMYIFMGWKDALSSSLSIPLVLGLTFVFSLIIGDNINKISLFALILVLGMLVDDSILVVENISRHLREHWDKKVENLLPIILQATGEIGGAALFSTMTKIVAFLGMFFVSGMMGQYMFPIPKYAIIALSLSLVIAFSVNPFFSYIFASTTSYRLSDAYPRIKDVQIWIDEHILSPLHNTIRTIIQRWKEKTHHIQFLQQHSGKEFSIIHSYENLLATYLDEQQGTKRRKGIKRVFWIILGIYFVTLPALGVFRWRMLPKSNVNQVYIWIDAGPDYSYEKTSELATTLNQRLQPYMSSTTGNNDEELHIINTISYRIGIAPTSDFANAFRGASMRQSENQISMKLNLTDKETRDITSEAFVLALRDKLQPRLLKNYPGTSLRLLEDPPGPPVKATWMLKVQSDTTTPRNHIITTAQWLYKKLQPDLYEYDVVDHSVGVDRQPNNIDITIDHEAIAKAGLSVDQVSHTLYSLFEGVAINSYYNPNAKEPLSISIKVKDLYTDYQSISFTNPQGEKIPLTAIATISTNNHNRIQYFDDGKPTTYLYGEIGNNSVIYPMISFLWKATSDDFWEGRFHITSWDLYGIQLLESGTNTAYTVSFGGERELSMDTFRDLGIALGLTLFALYIIVSIRFKGFGMGGIIMLPFLFGFIGILPGYSLLYLLHNEYFSATSMIGVIALAGISIGNSIILLEYFEELEHQGLSLQQALIKAGATRLKPIFLTSGTAIIGAIMILGDPVWSGLAWSIIRGLGSSAILTLLLIPLFVYDSLSEQKTNHP